MTDKTKAQDPTLLDEAVKNYEPAFRTGLKLQEDIAKCWAKLVAQPRAPQDLQKHWLSGANEVIPVAQKSLGECFVLLEQNCRASVDLLKKGLEVAQTIMPAESEKRLLEFCEGSLKSLKSNVRAIAELNTKAIDSWMNMSQRLTASLVVEAGQRA